MESVGCLGLLPVPVRTLAELVRTLQWFLWSALLPFVPASLALQNLNLLGDCRHEWIIHYYSMVVKLFICYGPYNLEELVNRDVLHRVRIGRI